MAEEVTVVVAVHEAIDSDTAGDGTGDMEGVGELVVVVVFEDAETLRTANRLRGGELSSSESSLIATTLFVRGLFL